MEKPMSQPETFPAPEHSNFTQSWEVRDNSGTLIGMGLTSEDASADAAAGGPNHDIWRKNAGSFYLMDAIKIAKTKPAPSNSTFNTLMKG